MTTEIEKAKQILRDGGHTCVLVGGGNVYISDARGVKPLVAWYISGENLSGYSAADKVVGRGAAYLYLLLGIRALHAGVISTPALSLLTESGVAVTHDTLVENIVNRRGDGICPFEEAVLNIHAREDAYRAILKKMEELNITP